MHLNGGIMVKREDMESKPSVAWRAALETADVRGKRSNRHFSRTCAGLLALVSSAGSSSSADLDHRITVTGQPRALVATNTPSLSGLQKEIPPVIVHGQHRRIPFARI